MGRWVKRALIWDRAAGPMVYDYDEKKETRTPHYLTPEELFDHAGVATNATVLTPAEFRKRVFNSLEEDAKHAVARFERDREKADA